MKIKFTDKNDKEDYWVEEYKSLEEITDEVKEGCILTMLVDCEKCGKRKETKDKEEAMGKICKKCQKEVEESE